MDVEERLRLILAEPTEEVLTVERLRGLLEAGETLRHYIGFEISGLVHIGTGLVATQKIADLQRAGAETTVFLADYHSWLNRKLGGDLDLIRRVGGGYFKEALKMGIRIAGGDPDATRFVMASDLYREMGLDYFTNVLKVSRNVTLSRVRRSVTIMGRREREAVEFGQLLYVPMQVADIFSLGVNIAHGGTDQRKAHVIAIDVGDKAFGYKPVALHHHLLTGLSLSQEDWRRLVEARERGDREAFADAVAEVKMSKSKPRTAIFIHDTEEEIRRKLRKAFCPAGRAEYNPVLEIARYILFRHLPEGLEIVNKKTGERRTYKSYSELEEAYRAGRIHPLDLKEAVARELARLLEPARRHFLEGPGRRYLEEMREIRVTR